MNKIKSFFLLAILTFSSLQVSAQSNQSKTLPDPRPIYSRSENQPHIGVLGGVINTNNTGENVGEYGLDFGYQPYIPYGLGVEVTRSESADTNGDNNERTSLLAKGSYNFGGNSAIIRNSYVGVALGTILRNDNSYFAGGPLLGFDVPVSDDDKLSLGVNAKYLMIDGTEPDALSVNGAIKYWF
ncbi:MAG: hypothetical protein ABL930_08380 [Pseudobdellovibrio sp.]